MENALSVKTRNLSVAYDDKVIVKNQNIKILKGKITIIIGPNGCGKSTTLKAIGRILKPKNGVIELDGKDINTMTTNEIALKMAILPQTPQAPEGLTVEELVSYGRFPHRKGLSKSKEGDREVVKWALDTTKLSGLENTMVDNLSGGQRQRVWIAMALAQQSDLILLDEPTTYLDLSYQLEVLKVLYRLNREEGCTIAMVLHDLNLASRFADYMIAVRDGEVTHHGNPEEVMTPEVLRETFNIDAVISDDPKTGKPTCISYDLINE